MEDDMLENISLLMAATGDNNKPLLVAVCLIVSIILIVVLVVTGKNIKDSEDEDNDIDGKEE